MAIWRTLLDRVGKAADKRFVGRKSQTCVKATPAGRRAVAEHVAYPREILSEPRATETPR